MSSDFAAKELAFVTSLKEDTGRDLAAWMAAIKESGLAERNDIIDWLRHKRFTFANASWLERIHNNGGRLIYGDQIAAPAPSASPAKIEVPKSEVAPAPAAHGPPAVSPPSEELAAMLATAKGLKPLAELILGEVRAVVPDVTFRCEGPLIVAYGPAAFAALHPGPKRLKLYGEFAVDPLRLTLPAELVNKAPPPFPRMVALDDARRVDRAFRELVAGLMPPERFQLRA